MKEIPEQLEVNVSNLINILSDRFHENKLAGLREAVQNSIDAGAEHIDISITDDKIKISDDGEGMSKEDIKEFWSKIASTDKDVDSIGEFGIGRISLLALSDHIYMHTKKGNKAYKVVINKKGDVEWERMSKEERGTTVWVKGNFEPRSREMKNYLREVCGKRPEEITVNGSLVSQKEYRARGTDVSISLNGPIGGKLGIYNSKEERGIKIYSNGLFVTTKNIKESVTGEVNYNNLKLVATRDGIQKNEDYENFLEELESKIQKLWKKVSESKFVDIYKDQLYGQWEETEENSLLENITVETHDGRRMKQEKVLEKAEEENKDLVFISGERKKEEDKLIKMDEAIGIKVDSGSQRQAINSSAEERDIESHYNVRTIENKLEELDDTKRVDGKGFGPLEEIALEMLEPFLPYPKVGFISSSTTKADIEPANRVRFNIKNPIIQKVNKIAKDKPFLAKTLLIETVAHELTHYKMGTEEGTHNEFFYSKMEKMVRKITLELIKELENS